MKRFLVLILCAVMLLTGCSSSVKHTTETFEDFLYQSFDFKEETLNTPSKNYEVKGKVSAEKIDESSTADYFILMSCPVYVKKAITNQNKWGNNNFDYEDVKIGDFLFIYGLFSCEGRSRISLYQKAGECNLYYLMVDKEKETFVKVVGFQDGYSGNFIMDYDFAVKNGYIEDVKDYSFN